MFPHAQNPTTASGDSLLPRRVVVVGTVTALVAATVYRLLQALTHTQTPPDAAAAHAPRALRKVVGFIGLMILAVGVMLTWRGMYNLFDLYFFPEAPFYGNLASAAIGIVIIVLMGGQEALSAYVG